MAFLRLHGVSSGRLTRLLSNQAQHGGVPKLDARGHKEPPNKTSEENLAFVRSHIESFPVYESHYSRSDNPDRKYLSPDLSVVKMHYLYKEKCDKEEQRAVSDWVYRKIFNEEYNLSFRRCVSIHHTLSPHPFLPHTQLTHPSTTLSPHQPLTQHTLIPPTTHPTHPHPTNPSPHTPSSHQPLTPHTFIPPTPQFAHMLTKSPFFMRTRTFFIHATQSFLHPFFFLHHTPSHQPFPLLGQRVTHAKLATP